MKIASKFFLFVLPFAFYACDNEVDLNADFEDTTVIYSLINAYEDSHFVKVNRAYIEENANAIELAADPDNFFYENLSVQLIRFEGDTIDLVPIQKRKNDGLFSSDKNIVYASDANLAANTRYDLKVTQDDGKVSSAAITTLGRTGLTRPGTQRDPNDPSKTIRRSLAFVDQRGLFVNYEFIIRFSSSIAEAQISLNFLYDEEDGTTVTRKSALIPVGGIRNPELGNENASIFLNGEIFYRTIGDEVPDNGLKKVVQLRDNIQIVVTAVDPNYSQYTQIYGPLDGLAQVRPEFTNVNNGIGLVASRSSSFFSTNLDQRSYGQLLNGPYTGDLNFSSP